MAWRGRDEALQLNSIEELREYIRSGDYSNWRPSGIVAHNTAAPTLEDWWHGGTSPEQRMENLKNYYENDMGWSAGPHCFIDGVSYWIMTDFWVSGVHSPSWNGSRLGIEHVGDYDSESDETGMGKKVWEMGHALFGECCTFFGWEANNEKIKFHYEDPATDHACPGDNVSKPEFVADVNAYMGDAGGDTDEPQEPIEATVTGLESGDTLNVREAPSTSAEVVAELREGAHVMVDNSAWNGSTQWAHIVEPDGWASAAYLEKGHVPVGPEAPYPHPMPPPFGALGTDIICAIADRSEIAQYSWRDRGRAPIGYTRGMAIAFALCLRKLLMYDPAIDDIAKAATDDPDTDVLAWYADIFRAADMSNEKDGVDTLRHLFVLMMGLGMRESSGKHCEGRDMSADNVQSETAEAGLFQMSWNASNSTDLMQGVMDQYADEPPQCALPVFSEGVSCSSDDWSSYGSGDGRKYQDLAKSCPQFAVECAALALRHLRQHFGPINRKEAEVREEADRMLREVQTLVLRPRLM